MIRVQQLTLEPHEAEVGAMVALASADLRDTDQVKIGTLASDLMAAGGGCAYTLSRRAAPPNPGNVWSTTIVRGDGRCSEAIRGYVNGTVVDHRTGSLYFTCNYAVYRIDGGGRATLVAGGIKNGDSCGSAVGSVVGAADGKASAARFGFPSEIAMYGDGTLLVVDWENNRLRTVAADGQVSTLAGSGPCGPFGRTGISTDGPGGRARFVTLKGVCVDRRDDTAFVVDGVCIRRVARDGAVTTIAGRNKHASHADGVGDLARFTRPRAIAIGEDATLYVAEAKCVRSLTCYPSADEVAERMHLVPEVAALPAVPIHLVLSYLLCGWHVRTIAGHPLEVVFGDKRMFGGAYPDVRFDSLVSIVCTRDAGGVCCVVHDDAVGRSYRIAVC